MIFDFAKHLQQIEQASTSQEIEALRVELLGKKGILTDALKDVANLSIEERKTKGRELNELKQQIVAAIDERKSVVMLMEENQRLANEVVDITLSPEPHYIGKQHPITAVIDELRSIFGKMGFEWREGALIEDEEHNFDALNIPEHHPARQMHDTFYVAGEAGYVLRTHSSPVQIRTMRNEKPPIRIITAGATFRSDSDQTHTPMFHQLEGLYIDRHVNMGHLKGCLQEFLQAFFGIEGLPIRFRPSFFPFTEPSAEIDIGCKRGREAIEIGKGDDWLEVMGCGMVHPNVLRNCGLDPNEYHGFAFGMGIERLAMLKYNIADLRTFFHSQQEWLHHYGF
jgi:phenylalanyl-tRNA synthetase alpha chain